MEGARRLDEANEARRLQGADPTSCDAKPRRREIIELRHRRPGRVRRLAARSFPQAAHRAHVAHAHPGDHRRADLVPRRADRARPSSPVRAGETILLRRPAPVEPEVPRHFEILVRGRQRAGHRQAGGAADAHDRQVLAQHADRAAARALPRRADGDRPPHRSRDLRACCSSRATARSPASSRGRSRAAPSTRPTSRW